MAFYFQPKNKKGLKVAHLIPCRLDEGPECSKVSVGVGRRVGCRHCARQGVRHGSRVADISSESIVEGSFRQRTHVVCGRILCQREISKVATRLSILKVALEYAGKLHGRRAGSTQLFHAIRDRRHVKGPSSYFKHTLPYFRTPMHKASYHLLQLFFRKRR